MLHGRTDQKLRVILVNEARVRVEFACEWRRWLVSHPGEGVFVCPCDPVRGNTGTNLRNVLCHVLECLKKTSSHVRKKV